MKLFYVDLETTGVNYWQHGIHQLSGMIEIDGEIKETFDFKMRPDLRCKIDDEALAIGHISREILDTYPYHDEVYLQLVKMLAKYVNKYDRTDKFHIVGYNNASFDNNFLRAFFRQNNDNYFGSWFWSSSIDVMVLAAWGLSSERHLMENFKLMTVAKKLGIEIDESKLHDGLYDVQLTRHVLKIITAKL